MTHNEYITNIQYKIDRLFYEYDTIEMYKHQNYEYYNEYSNFNHYDTLMLEAEKKKGIIGRIIDGIMKIIRTIVDKVKTFFSKNKPDPKTEVMVPKSLITKTDILKKLKSTILKGLAVVGALEVGGIVINRIDKGPNIDPTTNELKGINKMCKRLLANIKEREKDGSQDRKTKVKINSSKIIEEIKRLTGVLTDIDNEIKKIQNNSLDDIGLRDINIMLSSCNDYVFAVETTVNYMIQALNEGVKGNESLKNTIKDSSEIANFYKAKDTAINRAADVTDNILKNIKPKIDEELKLFESHDRKAKNPKAKLVYTLLKEMYRLAFNTTKYNNDPDQYKTDLKIKGNDVKSVLSKYDFDDDYIRHSNSIVKALLSVGKAN